jgi:hypothetical protein
MVSYNFERSYFFSFIILPNLFPMSFASSISMSPEMEDFPASSVSINASNTCTVTGSSSSYPDNDDLSIDNLSDGSEEPESQVKKRKAYSMKISRTSWIWDHFNRMEEKKVFAFCTICGVEVHYSKDYITSMLVRHVRRHHKQVYKNHLEAEAQAKLASENKASGCQQSMQPFLMHCPKFETCLINWMVATYQPLHCCEDQTFRDMCLSLNKKAPILSRDKLRTLLSEEYTMTKSKLKMILKGRHFSITTDGWTSLANVGYVTCTAHFIDPGTWKLYSIVMGLFEKNGDDVVD